jgi:hypothetical protein
MGTGECSLGLLDFPLELLNCPLILTNIIILFLLDEFDEVIDDTLIEILSS